MGRDVGVSNKHRAQSYFKVLQVLYHETRSEHAATLVLLHKCGRAHAEDSRARVDSGARPDRGAAREHIPWQMGH